MKNEELLIPSQIVHSKRRSIALVVDRNGDLIVRAPLKCRQADIDDFIKSKADWIIKKRLASINSTYKPLTFKGNEKITILGMTFNIILTDTKRVSAVEGEIYVPKTEPELYLRNYLVKLCKYKLPKRVDKFCEKYGFKYNGITITSATTRWGSCSFNNHLNFSYKSIMCPPDVLDYLVVHELTHTKVKNHSAKFWQQVALVLPNYKMQEKWLKDNRTLIDVI